MEPEQQAQQQPAQEEQPRPLSQSYQEDLSHAMNATDASVVQELLADAREREQLEVVEAEEKKEQKWYSVSSTILIFLTLAVLIGGAYYYTHLTVKVQPPSSVGVFQNSDSVVASSTNLQQVLAAYTPSTTLPVNKPTLINLVTDSTSNALISDSQLFSFIGAPTISEPLQSVITSARLGVVNIGSGTYPFVVASVADSEKASKEFGIAEPTLLPLFSPALAISSTAAKAAANQPFQSQYFYNLPMRVLETIDPATKQPHIVLMYGYVSSNIIVITSQPEVVKAVYDSIINQQ